MRKVQTDNIAFVKFIAPSNSVFLIYSRKYTRNRTMNETQRNCSDASNTTDALALRTKFINSTVIVISSTIVSLTSIAVFTLYKCKRMPFQLKWLSYNVIATDLVLHIFLVCMSISMLILGPSFEETIFYWRVVIGGAAFLVSLASISGLTFERLFALTRTMVYSRVIDKRNIRILSSYIWIVHYALPLSTFFIPFHISCNMSFSSCDINNYFFAFRITVAIFYVIYNSFVVLAYVKISKIIRHHVITITKQIRISTIEKNQPCKNDFGPRTPSANTITILKIIWTYEVTNLPIFIHSVIFVFIPSLEVKTFQVIFHVISYMCNVCNLVTSLYLYVWRIRECKLVFLKTFLSWNAYCRRVAETLRMDVYDIITHGGHNLSLKTSIPSSGC